jgi:hypothetical protein
VLSGSQLNAQESDYGSWFIYFGNARFTDKWSLFIDIQYRDYSFFSEFEALMLRFIGQYDVHKDATLALGYANFITQPVVDDHITTRVEYRIFQQFFLRQKFSRVYLNHRYRFEQRIWEDDFQMRFRYFLQMLIIFNKKKLEKNAFYFSSYGEIFLNTQSPIYDRLRAFFGLGYQVSPSIRVEVGNLSQVYETYTRNQLNIFLIHNFSFSKN